MKIVLITIGSPKLAYAQAGFNEYVSRLKHYHSVELKHLSDKQNNAAAIKLAAGNAYKVALVIGGQQLSSPQLAAQLDTWALLGKQVAFLIGGPDGLPSEIISASDYQLSFSQLTFPHDLAMVILAETLYRASTIAAGQPYHR